VRGWLRLLPVLLVICGACAQLPEIRPAPADEAPLLCRVCRQLFPQGKWRFVHTVEADLPDNGKTLAIGISLIDSAAAAVHAVIVSIEGLTVFDAVDDGQLSVIRALPPFDRPAFARGLMQDVKMIFFEPAARCTAVGTLETGPSVCRYQSTPTDSIDVRIPAEDRWEVIRYDAGSRVIRRLEALACPRSGADPQRPVPCRLTLTAYGRPGYTLSMKLVEAEKLED
jgi:hypothetical protein